MNFKEDIEIKINSDFNENSDQAFVMLKNAIKKTSYLETDRIIRSIIFLSKGNLKELDKHIEIATLDPRDIMLCAEYEKLSDLTNFKRIRDFNKTFEKCDENVKE